MPTLFVAKALNEYDVLAASPGALTVKTPMVPGAESVVTPAAPITGLLFVDVGATTIPRLVIAAPPSLVTLPPRTALFGVMLLLVGEVITGAVCPTGFVAKDETGEVYPDPALFVAKARNE